MADGPEMDVLEGLAVVLVLIVYLPIVALIVLFVTLIVTGRAPRRNYPSCGRCGFDLTGTLGTSDTCPECGTSIGIAGVCPIRSGRRRSTGTLGLIVALISVIVFWFMIFAG